MRAPVFTLVGALLALGGPVTAQDANPVKLTVDVGFVDVSGNTDVTTFNLGEKLTYAAGRWSFAQTAATIYGQSGGGATAEQYEAGLRADYTLLKRVSAFAAVGYYRNVFAGIAERFNEGVGLAWRAVVGPQDSLRLEGAFVVNQERNLADSRRTFGASRAGLDYRHAFGAAAVFMQGLEWIASVEDGRDQRINSETAISAPISRQIALKAAYLIKYDRQPELGKRDTDRTFTTGLQIVF